MPWSEICSCCLWELEHSFSFLVTGNRHTSYLDRTDNAAARLKRLGNTVLLSTLKAILFWCLGLGSSRPLHDDD
jgi:hypothetical protein